MNNHTPHTILFFGAGNMGKSIAKGLLANGWTADTITFCDTDTSRHTLLLQEFPDCRVLTSVDELCSPADVIMLAVKPYDMKSLCKSLDSYQQVKDALYISVAAGLPVEAYQQWLGEDVKIVRCMPNTPAAIGTAMTGLYAGSNISAADKSLADQILNSIGETLWVNKESLLDAVTALSGSGPAYIFYLAECMQNAGQNLGLSCEESYRLTLQTLLGAAQLAKHQAVDFSTLRANVTSKGGTTEQAINCFMQNNLNPIVDQALSAAANRAKEISQNFDKE